MGTDPQTLVAAWQLREMWDHKACSEEDRLGPGFDKAFADWIMRYGFERVADAVSDVSAVKFSEDGKRLHRDVRNVPRYAAVELAEEREPGMRDCYLIRGRLRAKFYCSELDDEIVALLARAMRDGVGASAMHDAVDHNETLEDFFASLGIDRAEFRIAMGQAVVDLPLKRHVFIREDDPEWPKWDAHWRKTRGIGPPKNKHFGWYFPSRLPPSSEVGRRSSRRSPRDKN